MSSWQYREDGKRHQQVQSAMETPVTLTLLQLGNSEKNQRNLSTAKSSA
jgi:hypothetical protein